MTWMTNLKITCEGFPVSVLESEFPIQKRDLGTIWFGDVISSPGWPEHHVRLTVLTTAHGRCWVYRAHSINSVNCINCYFFISKLLPIFTFLPFIFHPVGAVKAGCLQSSPRLLCRAPEQYFSSHHNWLLVLCELATTLFLITVKTIRVSCHQVKGEFCFLNSEASHRHGKQTLFIMPVRFLLNIKHHKYWRRVYGKDIFIDRSVKKYKHLGFSYVPLSQILNCFNLI